MAISPGRAYVGRWSIPVRLNGRPRLIAGGLYYASAPSIAWFWPIIVLIACTLAAARLRREQLDARLARLLAVAALAATIVAAVGRELHGRPGVSVFQIVTFAAIVAFVLWTARKLLQRHETYFTFFALACVAIWEGANLLPTLWNGFVLAAVPAFAARTACVLCLGCGIGVLVLSSRQVMRSDGEDAFDEDENEDEDDILGSSAPDQKPGTAGATAADPR